MSVSNWVVDAVYSSAEFHIQHLAVSTYHGRFRSIQGKLSLDEANPSASSTS